jgi:sugar-specific transcriptional regulator TrmB
MTAPRGTDPRLDLSPRRTTSQRRERYHERMDAKAEARAELEQELDSRGAGGVGAGTRTTRERRWSRADLNGARRVVVKVGSSSISGENAGKIQPIVEALAEAHGRGTEVVLVSSGAIATGMPYLALDERPVDLATQQAAAAVGQNVLIYRYQDALRPSRSWPARCC